jgi:hypothetical protein
LGQKTIGRNLLIDSHNSVVIQLAKVVGKMGEMGDPSVLLRHYDKLGGVKSRMQVRAEGNGVCYIVDDGVPDQLAVHVVLRHSILVKPVYFTARV